MIPPEYQEYLNKNLSVWERATAALSGLDERLDYTNILLTRLVKLASGGISPSPESETASRLVATLNNVATSVNNLVKTLGGEPKPFALANPGDISVGRKLVGSAGTAVQLPSVLVPYDFEVVICAPSGNTGTIYLGNSKVNAEDHNTAFPLKKGGAVELKIKSLGIMWIDSSVSSEGINWIVEKEE